MAAATRNTAIPAPKAAKRTLPVNTITPTIPAIRAKTPTAATIHPNASLIIIIVYYTHKVIIPYYCTELPYKTEKSNYKTESAHRLSKGFAIMRNYKPWMQYPS